MASPHLQFSVVTAEGPVADGQAVSVTIPTQDGEITVLPNHIPLVSVLVPGVITVRHSEGGAKDDYHLAVSGGFVHVTAAEVTILADTAERADVIDVTRAEQARQRAAELMAGKLEKQELAEAQAALQKNLARLRAAELIKHKRRTRREV